jgi:hypothetical protein
MNAAAAIVGALGLIWLALLVLLVIWRLCNGREAAKAQASHVADRYVLTTIPDEIVHTEAGAFRVSDGEWVPFDDRRAA